MATEAATEAATEGAGGAGAGGGAGWRPLRRPPRHGTLHGGGPYGGLVSERHVARGDTSALSRRSLGSVGIWVSQRHVALERDDALSGEVVSDASMCSDGGGGGGGGGGDGGGEREETLPLVRLRGPEEAAAVESGLSSGLVRRLRCVLGREPGSFELQAERARLGAVPLVWEEEEKEEEENWRKK